MKLLSIIYAVTIVGCMNVQTFQGVLTVQENLSPCGASPNCVSTEGPKERLIEPLPYFGSDSFSFILQYLKKHYNTEVLEESATYLHVVITTNILRFKDDLEFMLKPELGVIEMRSASRVGYYDMGINRKRLEKLRVHLEAL